MGWMEVSNVAPVATERIEPVLQCGLANGAASYCGRGKSLRWADRCPALGTVWSCGWLAKACDPILDSCSGLPKFNRRLSPASFSSAGTSGPNNAPAGAWVLSVEGQSPLPIDVAARVLLEALGSLARDRKDVREALTSLHSWLGGQLDTKVVPLAEKTVSGDGGRRVVTDSARTERWARESRSIDMAQVKARSSWKEAALRFAAERLKRDGDPTGEMAKTEADLRAQRAQLEDAYPWMLDSSLGGNSEAMLDAADCYGVVVFVAQNVQELTENGAMEGGAPSELLYLVAEAQSALLSALGRLGQRTDSDQRDLFLWLKDQTHRHRIYVDRHMRLEDPADAQGSADRLRRLAERFRLMASGAEASRERTQLLNKVRFHTLKCLEHQRILEGDATTLVATLGRWRELGLPRSDRSLQELLGSISDLAEGELAQGIAWVTEGERNNETKNQERRSATEEVRALLNQREVLALALDEMACDKKKLADSLALSRVHARVIPETPDEGQLAKWIDDSPNSLVLLGRRLDEGAYDTFKRLCLERGRLFVRLPEGFEPEHVARQVLRQVGWRLRPAAAKRNH